MIDVAFDTNLWYSYLLTHRPPLATLIDHHLVRGDFQLVTTGDLLKELRQGLDYLRLRGYLDEAEPKHFSTLLWPLSTIVFMPSKIPPTCHDPHADHLIICAVLAEVDVLVSDNRDLLALGQVAQIPILSPARFLALLATG